MYMEPECATLQAQSHSPPLQWSGGSNLKAWSNNSKTICRDR